MSAQIYEAPTTIKKPEFNFSDIKGWREEEERYENELRAHCERNGTGDLKGKVIKIPHADSYAVYMVFSLRPLELIHMEIGDAWDSEFADLVTEAKVREMVKRDEAMAKLFGGNG